jgi:hypothetical protein
MGGLTESHAKLLAQINPECGKCPAFWRLVGRATMYANPGDANRRTVIRESHAVAADIRRLTALSYSPGHEPGACSANE